MPEISVLMSVYNGAQYVERAVESILTQSFKDFEFIIINDGSTDGSAEILKRYAGSDQRINLINQENRGLVAALNTGLEISSTPLIARMDADDIALRDRLEKQKDYMDTNPKTIVLGGATILIDENDQEFGRNIYPSKNEEIDNYIFTRGSPVAHPAVIMKRKEIFELGGYRAAYKHAEDYDLWLRVHKGGGVIDNLKTPILKYRQHNQKISVQNARQQALVSVVARYAAHTATDPTEKLDNISEDALKLFKADQNKMQWEIFDIISSGLLIAPDAHSLKELSANIPDHISSAAKVIAAQSLLKLAYVSQKNKLWSMMLKYLLRAFFTAPVHSLKIIFKRLSR